MRQKITINFIKKTESMGIQLVKDGNVFKVRAIDPNSYVSESLQVGDEIFAVNGLPLDLLSGQQFYTILKAFPMDTNFSLSYYREGDIINGMETTETLAKVDQAMFLLKQFKGQHLHNLESTRQKEEVSRRQIAYELKEIAWLIKEVEAKKKELQEAKLKLEDIQDRSLCCVCMDQSIDTLIEPCRHACACENCLRRVNRCPICRADIARLTRIYPG